MLLVAFAALVLGTCSSDESASPTPMPTEEVSAFALLEDAVASVDGFGFLTVGTRTLTIEERYGIRVIWECGGGLIAPDGPDNVVAVTTTSGVIERIDLFLPSRTSHPGRGRWLMDIDTDAGVSLGENASAIEEGYDEPLIELEPDPPAVDSEVMFVGDEGRVIVYTVDDGVVTNIRLGERSRAEPRFQCE